MCYRKSVGVVILLLAIGAMILFAGNAEAQSMTWTAGAGWTDNASNTGTFTPAEMGTMKFYLRARKQGDAGARKYFGETANGVSTWAGDFETRFIAGGLATPVAGEIWEFTVSQAFKNSSGVELDSIESIVALYQFPFAPDRAPSAPSGPVITE